MYIKLIKVFVLIVWLMACIRCMYNLYNASDVAFTQTCVIIGVTCMACHFTKGNK